MQDNVDRLIDFLIYCRKKYDLFSIEKAAADLKLCSMTIRNFETHQTYNGEIILYYTSVLWKALEEECVKTHYDSSVSFTDINTDLETLLDYLRNSYNF